MEKHISLSLSPYPLFKSYDKTKSHIVNLGSGVSNFAATSMSEV